MKYIKRYLVLILGVITIYPATAQDVVSQLETYASHFSPERAYLHYDKSAYAPGETIWFKAYLLNEISAATESKTFYVDWIDDKGKILQHTVSPLVEGLTNGQFDVPGDYKGRFIAVRAYTRWMLNFDSAFLYKKNIPVLSKDSLPAAQKPVIKPTLEFFPEGGDVITSIYNKIAFKATDQWGRPVKIKGIISGSDGKPVDSLKVLHDGMGFVMLKPAAGVTYTAKWKDAKNVQYTTVLPQAKKEGAVLQVGVSHGRRDFKVSLSPGLTASTDTVYLVGTMFQHTVFKIAKSAKVSEITGVVPTVQLPYGILTITLFDKSWKPLAERITYIDNQLSYTFKPGFEVQRWGLSYRARNEVTITVPDSIAASLSISVTDLNIDADSSNNIISDLMLASELKGSVYRPAYYFTGNPEQKQQHLDLVMLTNGWRRINWQQIVSGKLPGIEYPRDTAYLSLSGNVQGLIPGSIGDGAGMMLIVKQKNVDNKLLLMPINRSGSFNDPSFIIFDTAQVYYKFQNKNLEGGTPVFMPYKLRIPPLGKNWHPTIFPDTSGARWHLQLANEFNANLERNKFKELEAVTIRAKAKPAVEVMDEKYAKGLFTGDGIKLDVLNDPFSRSGGDIFTYLRGKVAGLQVSGQGANASLNWRGGAPQIYLDETPVDVNAASNINLSDVAYIKAFRPPFMGGFNGANGAIAIYTRRGDDVKPGPGKGLTGIRVEGYTLIREFYSPKYYTPEAAPGADRDVRTTIYWNPNIVVDPRTKKATVSFYNNDVTDAFRVVIEGMTTDGKLAHLEERMQ